MESKRTVEGANKMTDKVLKSTGKNVTEQDEFVPEEGEVDEDYNPNDCT